MNPKEFTETIVHFIAPTANPLVEYLGEEKEIHLQVEAKNQGRIIGRSGINIAALIVVVWYYGLEKIKHPIKLVLHEPFGEKKGSIPFMPQTYSELGEKKIKSFIRLLLEETGTKNSVVEFQQEANRKIVEIKINKTHEERYRDPDFTAALAVLVKVAARNEGIFLNEVKVKYG